MTTTSRCCQLVAITIVLGLSYIVTSQARRLTFEATLAREASPSSQGQDQGQCDDDSTYCQQPSGEAACCPFKNAKCCSDGLHCCPSDTECDVDGKQCKIVNVNTKDNNNNNNNIVSAVRAQDEATAGITCPDRSVCPYAHAACCRHIAGGFSCCNYPNNVCCDGGVHCCPVGTVCDPITYACYTYPSDVGPLAYGWAKVVMPPPKFSPARPAK